MFYGIIAIFCIFTFIFAFSLGSYTNNTFSKPKYGGTFVVEKYSSGRIVYTLEVDGDLEDLQYKKEIVFKVAPVDVDDDVDAAVSLDRE